VTATQYECLLVEAEDAVRIIRLNRPEKLNAINPTLKAELTGLLDELEADDEVRVVVLAGAGRAFSAGADLARVHSPDRVPSVTDAQQRLESGLRLAEQIWRFRKPIIAAVHGYCLGIACELAMVCDLTIAEEGCQLGEPEIRFSSASPILVMPWLVPMKVAKELLLSGGMIDAKRAYEIGMINEVAPEGELMEAALRRAKILAAISPLATRLTKEGINRSYEIMGIATAIAQHANLAAILDGTQTEEFQAFAAVAREEGVRAAIRWRDAQFQF
jgi:enoyl-CoA hydratase